MEEIKRQALSSVAQAPLDNFGRFNDDEVEGAGDDSHGASIFAGAIRRNSPIRRNGRPPQTATISPIGS
jgi:hypothetical protein